MFAEVLFWLSVALAGVLGVLFVKFAAAKVPWLGLQRLAAAL